MAEITSTDQSLSVALKSNLIALEGAKDTLFSIPST